MKIAISGKGGVGKTLLAATLSRKFADSGYSVLAIDADPDANLAASLGFPNPDSIVPLSEMKELVAERTGAEPGKPGVLFKLNPKVDDLPEKYCVRHDGIRLMVMGRAKQGGSGCYCSEGTLLKALVNHLLLARKEVVIMDMEAGIEHLGRATASAVDRLLIVVEPGRRSLETAHTIRRLAADIGLPGVAVVGNKVRNEADREFITESLPGFEILGFIPYSPAVIEADLSGVPAFTASPQVLGEVESIFHKLIPVVHK
ncbi:MAG: AAA family ATPase [Chloroflexi bacterium]|nr:AAA family ATPase [Chloroflexota bacterium]